MALFMTFKFRLIVNKLKFSDASHKLWILGSSNSSRVFVTITQNVSQLISKQCAFSQRRTVRASMRKRDRERALTPKSDRAQESGGTTTNAGERGRGRERTSEKARKWESEKASKQASKKGDNEKNERAED